MPIKVDVVTLALYPAGSQLYFGNSFEWANPTSSPVTISCCQSFCTQGTYIVPAATGPGNPGTTPATLLAAPVFNFGDSAWNAPGMPHIVINSGAGANELAPEKEVA